MCLVGSSSLHPPLALKVIQALVPQLPRALAAESSQPGSSLGLAFGQRDLLCLRLLSLPKGNLHSTTDPGQGSFLKGQPNSELPRRLVKALVQLCHSSASLSAPACPHHSLHGVGGVPNKPILESGLQSLFPRELDLRHL